MMIRLQAPIIRCAALLLVVATACLAESASAQCPANTRPRQERLSQRDNKGVTTSKVGGTVQIEINWHAAACDSTDERVREVRVSTRTPVRVWVHNFNFLHYTLAHETHEDTVEAYRTLEKLWSQIYSVGGVVGLFADPGRELTPAERTLRDLRVALRDLDREVSVYLELTRDAGLTDTQVDSVRARGLRVAASLQNVSTKEQAAWTAASSGDASLSALDAYEKLEPTLQRVRERAQAFVAAADKTARGEYFTIQGRPSGTILTTTITAKDKNKATAGQPLVVEYMVQSRFPLVLHTGLAYTRLPDVSFDRVRAASGQDLFAITRGDSATTDLSAFLSLPVPYLQFGPDERHGVMATLGTELSDPGKTIFAGATLRLQIPQLGSIFLTGGGASREVLEGEGAVVDQVADELEVRELYNTITKRNDWGWYASISFGVID